MKNRKFNYFYRFLASTLFIISLSVGFTNTDENSETKKVPVKIGIGNSNCSGSGICGMTKVPKDQFSDVSGLTREFYGLIGTTYGGDDHYVIQTRSDLMSEQMYNQYFSGANFVMEDDFIIPKNTVGNKKAVMLKSGIYPIEERDGWREITPIWFFQ